MDIDPVLLKIFWGRAVRVARAISALSGQSNESFCQFKVFVPNYNLIRPSIGDIPKKQ